MTPRLDGFDLSLIDKLAVAASVLDATGRFVHMNEGAERASGTSSAKVVGRHFSEFLPPDARPHVEAHFRRAVEERLPADFETPWVDAAGHLRGTRAQYLPLQAGDEIVGVLILAFDVGPTRRAIVSASSQPRLTPRQHEVLELTASGLSTPEIASALTLANDTVRNHLRNVLRELGAHTRVEAIATARRSGLLAPAPLGPPPSE